MIGNGKSNSLLGIASTAFRGRLRWACIIMLVLSSSHLSAQLVREAATLVDMPQYAPNEGYGLVDALGLTFDKPVGIYSPPGDTHRLFILELSGRIMVVPDVTNPTKEVFMDLQAETVYHVSSLEAGLLGLAFHPDFATNGQFFVARTQYTTSSGGVYGLHNVVSRFTVSAGNPNRGDFFSQVYLMKQLDGSTEHNAGDLKFGPDGYLYVSVGDKSPTAVDASGNPQPLDRGHFGGILRIDVDMNTGNLSPNPHHSVSGNYLIPADNPFVGISEYQTLPVNTATLRSEFFAIGCRNPWKMTFNPSNGDLIVADVGAGAWEEVSLVRAGDNLEWPYREGELQRISPPSGFVGTKPLVTYPHDRGGVNVGLCVIGGVFYTGSNIPALQGAYIYGDYISGSIWHLFPQDDGVVRSPTGWLTSSPQLTSFGLDPDNGDVLVSNFTSGKIERLVFNSPEEALPFPATLTDTGLFSDIATLTPNPGVVPYSINHTFWSDHAVKTRWFGIPSPTESFGFQEAGGWATPPTAFWVKHFDFPLSEADPSNTRRLETRVIVKLADGEAYGVTYRWDEAQTEAHLVGAGGESATYQYERLGGQIENRQWIYPSRSECIRCHNSRTTRALGFSTAQLNRDQDYGSGGTYQLAAMASAGYISGHPPQADLNHLVETDEEEEGLYHRAKSYLAANCSLCHNQNSSWTWDARGETPLAEMRVLSDLIDPNNVSGSWLHSRANTRSNLKMPPVGSVAVDEEGMALLRRWINGFPQEGWEVDEVSQDHPWAGASREDSGTSYVSGSGVGLHSSSSAFVGLGRNLPGERVLIQTRMDSQSAVSGVGAGGIMLRGASGEAAASAAQFSVSQTGDLELNYRTDAAAQVVTVAYGTVPLGGIFLRLERVDDSIAPAWSIDGVLWNLLPAVTGLELGPETRADLVVLHPGHDPINTARFSETTLVAVSLEPFAGSSYIAQDLVEMSVNLDVIGAVDVSKVSYFSGDTLLGEALTTPFTFEWAAVAGVNQQMSAVVTMVNGATVGSSEEPLTVDPQEPEAGALASGAPVPNVDWIGLIGSSGYLLPGQAGVEPPLSSLMLMNGQIAALPGSVDEGKRLENPTDVVRVAETWRDDTEILLQLNLNDGFDHHLSLYSIEDTVLNRQQRVTIETLEGVILYQEDVLDLSDGMFLSAQVRGTVLVRITSLSPDPVLLAGLFIDQIPNQAPQVSLAEVGDRKLIAPSGPMIEASASDVDGQISHVEFFRDGVILGIDHEAPFLWDYAPLAAGQYALSAIAYDNGGRRAVSDPMNLAMLAPVAAVVYRGEDRTTEGTWTGVYGGNGWSIAGIAPALDNPLKVELPWATLVMHPAPEDDDPVALQVPGTGERTADAWESIGTVSVDVKLDDGATHNVAFYFTVPEGALGQLVVTAYDLEAGALLEQRSVSVGAGGVYQLWSVRGQVSFVVSPSVPFELISLGAVFIDPGVGGLVEVNPVTNGGVMPVSVLTGAITSVEVLGVAPELISRVELYEGSTLIGMKSVPPFDFRWYPATAGSHCLTARALTTEGAIMDSDPVIVTSAVPDVMPGAIFLGRDEKTIGNWIGVYGEEGYELPLIGTIEPSYGTFSTEARTFKWASSTPDPRALQRPGGLRRPATYVEFSSIEGSFDFSDGRWHNVALFFLDWDNNSRGEKVAFHDGGTGALLASHDISEFNGGMYLNWWLRGNVDLRISKLSGSNVLLNGVFFNPTSPYEEWSASYASAGPVSQLFDLSGDPDDDQLSNLFEFKLSLNPFEKQPGSVKLYVPRGDGSFEVNWAENPAASHVILNLQQSTDIENWGMIDPAEILRSPEAELDRRVYPLIFGAEDRKFFRLSIEMP